MSVSSRILSIRDTTSIKIPLLRSLVFERGKPRFRFWLDHPSLGERVAGKRLTSDDTASDTFCQLPRMYPNADFLIELNMVDKHIALDSG